MLTLGVPGSGTTAVMLGALMLYNIQPGRCCSSSGRKLSAVSSPRCSSATSSCSALNLPLVNIFARVLTMPNWILVPGILVLSVIGVYSTHASIFAIYLMLAIGIAGWLLRKAGFDMAPIILVSCWAR